MFIRIFAISKMKLILNDCNNCSSVEVTKKSNSLRIGFFFIAILNSKKTLKNQIHKPNEPLFGLNHCLAHYL